MQLEIYQISLRIIFYKYHILDIIAYYCTYILLQVNKRPVFITKK